ncbi:MAG: tetratricopeptide repeat protein [Oscillatoria sp. SIO1A7]|nr:tetratricopeptide repeat protein [Oscillatoria sp. SIO1A7]
MPTIAIREKQKTEAGFEAALIFDGGTEYPLAVTDPFEARQEKRLEWYFEQWLRFPTIDKVKASEAAASIEDYGKRLFEQIFRADIDAYSEYRQLRGKLGRLQIEIVGQSPEFQALHWEALRDPDLPRPLAVDCTVLRKHIRKVPVMAEVEPSPVINLLLVTARPNEENDVAYRTISRPLIETIKNSQLLVNVELLRPGTYEALAKKLEERGAGYYHAIHFDAHGALMTFEQFQKNEERRDRYSFQNRYGRSDLPAYSGVKAFLFLEGESKGKADPVEATELAELLTGSGIPICILNACQSGKQVRSDDRQKVANPEDFRETSLGSRLMAAGTNIVVAMGYSVTVTAAALMMEQLYGHLFAKQDIASAIRLGRRELYNNKNRRAYFNSQIDLEDWLLPVAYANRTLNLNLRPFAQEEEEQYYQALGSKYRFPEPEYGFVGRDLEILKIEKALLRGNILLLQGMGGSGKTTLLNYLREWWQTTNFAKEIFYFGYDQKAWTLEQILWQIGEGLYSRFDLAKFQATNLPARLEKLIRKLRAEPHILILDNLESVTGEALAIPNTLPEEERNQIRDFLARLVGGATRVVLGSRSDEAWLRDSTFKNNVYFLRGLDPEARSLLAQNILKRHLAGHLAANRIEAVRQDPEFNRLMKLLAGYPLAMEVVLANLKGQSPAEILEALAAADVNLDSGSDDKTKSILKCVEYSHSNLSPDAQKLLLCLAPFSGFIYRTGIPNYIQELQKLAAFESYSFDKFDEALDQAITWGLLSPIDSANPHLLTIQPVFPYFLKTKLVELEEATGAALEEGFKNHCRGLADSYYNLMQSKEPQERQLGLALCRLEYENLYRALQLCLARQEGVRIFFCLLDYFRFSNDFPSALKLSQFVNRALEAYPADLQTGKMGLEIATALGMLAYCYLETKNYPQAQESYQQLLALLPNLSGIEERERQRFLAMTYHQLGRVAEELREFSEARQFYQQALAIKIEYGDRHSQAGTYHQLGIVAEELREFAEARQFYQEALAIKIEDGDRFSQAKTYHQLGIVAQEMREFAEARQFYQQALAIYIEYGDRHSQAKTYHNLGRVAEEMREFAEARQLYQEVLAIYIEDGDRYSQAKTYHQLGVVAQKLRSLPEARQLYQEALSIFSEYSDRHSMASTYHNLGNVAQQLREFPEARQFFQQALDIYDKQGDRYSQAKTYHQLGRIAQQLRELPEARQFYEQALAIKIEYGDLFSQAGTYYQLGQAAEELGELQEAKANYMKALEIWAEFQDEHWLGNCLQRLGELYRATQDAELLAEVARVLGVTVEELRNLGFTDGG